MNIGNWKKGLTGREILLRIILSHLRCNCLCENCQKLRNSKGLVITECLDCRIGNEMLDNLLEETYANNTLILDVLKENDEEGLYT